MAKFAYNNVKNTSISHMPFELNFGYYLCISFKKDINSHSQLKTANKLLTEIRELMTICRKNLHHAQKLQKQAPNKNITLKNYVFNYKIGLNSKHMKTKKNRKFKNKFFRPLQVLYLIGK